MFEKEAEDYANKNVPTSAFGYRSFDDVHYDVKQAYRAGAELGYNKAMNEAKGIIKDLLHCLPKENIEGVYEVTEEAEQFLREIEE